MDPGRLLARPLATMQIESASIRTGGNRPVRRMLLAAALVAACITSFVVFNTREMTQARPISLFAIDEAHCV